MHEPSSELPASSARLAPFAIVRAVVIGVALLVATLQASPGKPVTKEQLEMPVNARPIGAVEDALRAVGFDLKEGAGAEFVITVSKGWTHTRHVLLRPFMAVFDELSMGQRWGLFTSKGSNAYRILVEVMRADQSWHPVYRAHQIDELGLSHVLSYRRLRGIYDPHSKDRAKEQYEPLATWLANDVLAAHPEYVGVRVSMERLKLGTKKHPTEVVSIEHSAETFRAGTP